MARLLITAGILLLIPSLLFTAQSSQVYGQTTIAGKVNEEFMSAVQAGNNFLKQIEDGGIAVIRNIADFFGARNIEDNIDKAGQELNTGDTESASSTIAIVDESLQNNSVRISGLAQYLSNIANNQSITMDEPTRQTLTEIADAFLNVSADTDGVYRSLNASL